ncbi:SIS domain-containing protein [Roseicyclus persicicus]|uniref:SIS domain-containing protein n=1 Tax=Roseicyclus persicicus TaxID=2650661 RepID=A0A7X6JXI2_9RHOB|nr:SIS domain-containing protein [Roseibacterium persicicum]NKX43105.1 SIS domain-containing protein [Roseibacterium persicicum]
MSDSQMRREIAEIPEAVARLLDRADAPVRAAAAAMRAADPAVLLTVARGSSDHACTYLKYVSELLLGLPVASVGPSVASVYGARLRVRGAVALAVSQSGQSPDIVEMTRSLGAGGALTVALTNDAGSRLAGVAGQVIDICAGPERSVAATKTFVTSALAGLWLLAEVKGDRDLLAAIHGLPAVLETARGLDWSPVAAALGGGSIFTLGRGPAWAIANEAALKFKEVLQVHAESYSSAEVLHGPVSIVDCGFPVLAFAAADAAETALAEVADALAAKGAEVFATTDRVAAARALPVVRTGHPLADPLALVVAFYAMIEQLAVARGLDPDMPRHLRKVTETT